MSMGPHLEFTLSETADHQTNQKLESAEGYDFLCYGVIVEGCLVERNCLAVRCCVHRLIHFYTFGIA